MHRVTPSSLIDILLLCALLPTRSKFLGKKISIVHPLQRIVWNMQRKDNNMIRELIPKKSVQSAPGDVV